MHFSTSTVSPLRQRMVEDMRIAKATLSKAPRMRNALI
jgi:hypothetical protein